MLSASLYENKNSLRERMEHVMKSYNIKKRPMAVAIMIYVFKRFRILSIRKESFACNKEMNRIFYEIKNRWDLGNVKLH